MVQSLIKIHGGSANEYGSFRGTFLNKYSCDEIWVGENKLIGANIFKKNMAIWIGPEDENSLFLLFYPYTSHTELLSENSSNFETRNNWEDMYKAVMSFVQNSPGMAMTEYRFQLETGISFCLQQQAVYPIQYNAVYEKIKSAISKYSTILDTEKKERSLCDAINVGGNMVYFFGSHNEYQGKILLKASNIKSMDLFNLIRMYIISYLSNDDVEKLNIDDVGPRIEFRIKSKEKLLESLVDDEIFLSIY